MSFAAPGFHLGHDIPFSRHVPLGACTLPQLVRLPLFLTTLPVLRTVQVFCSRPVWVHLLFFSWLDWGSGFWEEDLRGSHQSRVYDSPLLMMTLIVWLRLGLSAFSTVKLPFSPLSILYSLGLIL